MPSTARAVLRTAGRTLLILAAVAALIAVGRDLITAARDWNNIGAIGRLAYTGALAVWLLIAYAATGWIQAAVTELRGPDPSPAPEDAPEDGSADTTTTS